MKSILKFLLALLGLLIIIQLALGIATGWEERTTQTEKETTSERNEPTPPEIAKDEQIKMIDELLSKPAIKGVNAVASIRTQVSSSSGENKEHIQNVNAFINYTEDNRVDSQELMIGKKGENKTRMVFNHGKEMKKNEIDGKKEINAAEQPTVTIYYNRILEHLKKMKDQLKYTTLDGEHIVSVDKASEEIYDIIKDDFNIGFSEGQKMRADILVAFDREGRMVRVVQRYFSNSVFTEVNCQFKEHDNHFTIPELDK